MGAGITGANPVVSGLAVSGTNLYAVGQFYVAGEVGARYLAEWQSNQWSPVGAGVIDPYGTGYVSAVVMSGTGLYVGGRFNQVGSAMANYIAQWNGSAWSPLGAGMNANVEALAVSGANLYAGGDFTLAGRTSANRIARWDGSTWWPLGAGLTGVNADVAALAISGTNLYAGGVFTNAGGSAANYVARWDGAAWSALGSGVNGEVLALAVMGTNLYVGGNFTTAGGAPANYIARWDGANWSPLGSGFDELVWALAVCGTNLYAGGWFTSAGGQPANHLAKWDGANWSPLGSGVNSSVASLAADGAGHLFVGGYFSTAGTNTCLHIAQANVSVLPIILTLPPSQTVEYGSAVDLGITMTGTHPLGCQWLLNGHALGGSTNVLLSLPNVQVANGGAYQALVSNSAGATTSAPVMLAAIPPVPRRPVPAINVTGDSGSLANVDYADALRPGPVWSALGVVSLTNGTHYCFDTSVPLPSQRLYRAWEAGTPSETLSLSLSFVTAISLTGALGDALRVDYINPIGPTDAWVTLDTVTLTNASQYYFDVSALDQPPRLYRVVPVP